MPFHTPLIVGHIVGERPAGLVSWLAAVVLFGGLAGLLLTKRPWVRKAWAVVAVLGLAATVADYVSRSQRPPAPDLVIRVISPRERASLPLVIRVCGYTRAGTPVSVTAAGRFVLIRVDGVQRAEVHQSTVMLPVTRGRHLLSVEITSSFHQEFQPLVRVTRRIRAEPPSTAAGIPSCQRRVLRTRTR